MLIGLFREIPLKKYHILCLLVLVFCVQPTSEKIRIQPSKGKSSAKSVSKMDRIDLAMEQEYEMTRDPKTGLVPRNRLFAAKKIIKKQQQVKEGIPDISWEERGPMNVGGRTRSILIDANDPTGNTFFAGSVGGGLWKTTNALSSNPDWAKVDDFFESLAIGAIAQDPGNPDIIYFGTGEGYFNGDAITGMGIWKSTDGGHNFTYLESTESSDFRFIQSIVINSDGDVFTGTRNGGVQKSTDGGINFTKVLGNDIIADVDRVADMELSANGDIYAAMGIFQTDGIYKTTDAGTSWDLINSGLPANGFERIDLACAPSDNDVIYAILQDKITRTCKGIYQSTDGGISFVEKANPGALGMNNFCRNQAWYNIAAAVDPNNSDHILIGGIDILKSTDGGSNWDQITQWYGGGGMQYVHADQHAIAFLDSDIAFFGNDGGVYVTQNASSVVPDINSINNGYNVTQFYSAAIHPDINEHYFLAGAQDNGTQKFESEGMNNTSTATGGDGGYCHIDQNDPNVQITSYVYNNYRISTNGGASFQNRNFNNNGRFINPFAYDDEEKKLYGAYKTDQYFRWNNPANAGTSSDTVVVSEFDGGRVSHVSVSPNVDNRIYFGTGTGEVVYVDDAHTGNVKTGITIRTGGGYISCISIEEGNEDHLLITLSNYGVTSIYETFDGGSSWIDVEGNLPDMPIRWCIFNPNDTDQAILATELGVWTTNDLDGSDTTWDPSNNGLANVRVDMLKTRVSDSELIASTHGRGLFSTDHFSIITASFDIPENASSEFSNTGEIGVCGENYKEVILPVNLNKSPNGIVIVSILVENGYTAVENEDFELITSTLTFAPEGPLSQNVILRIYDDVVEENEESLALVLSISGGEEGAHSQYIHNIIDDDKNPITSPSEEDIDIGSGTELMANAPFKGFYEDERTQMIIRAEELANAGLTSGLLTKLAFEIETQSSNQPYQGFNIKLKHTSIDEFDSTSDDFETGLTTVFSGVFNPVIGWNVFDFNTDFEWNGEDNLLIDICFNNSSWTADDIVFSSETGYHAVLYRYADGGAGCSFSTGTQLSTKRPNLRFTQAIEFDVSGQQSLKNGSLETGETGHFYSSLGNLIMSVSNTGDISIGCADIEIDNYGNGQLFPEWLEGFGHSEKTFFIDAAPEASYNITLYFTEEELSIWPGVDVLGMIKTTDPVTNNQTGEFEFVEQSELTIENFGEENHYAFTASFVGFSGFALSDYNQSVVPLDLLRLNGNHIGDHNYIHWKTVNEISLESIELERSSDGHYFKSISSHEPKGGGLYEYLDYELEKNSEIYYYRLKMIDLGGKIEHSDYISVRMTQRASDICVYPNPCSDFLYIKTPERDIVSIELFNLSGNLMSIKNIPSKIEGPVKIDISELVEQIYIVRINSIGPGNSLISECQRIIKK